MNIIVIDCGATSTKYGTICENKKSICRSNGFSFAYQSLDSFPNIIKNEHDIIYIYGTGLTELNKEYWERQFLNRFKHMNIKLLKIASDSELAAVACSGNSPAYIHIMGTGSSMNFWDGKSLQYPKVNLGYIWEDSASGFGIGKKIISYWSDGMLSESEQDLLVGKYGSLANFISNCYLSKDVKNYISLLSTSIEEFSQNTREKIIDECLEEYFSKNINTFSPGYLHHFSGSVAFAYRNQLIEKANKYGITIGNVVKDPLDKALSHIYKLHKEK